MQNPDPSSTFMKGPKRKRLAKACDACHKSKRRCDGTAPCSNCYYASKQCTYTDASGRPVPAPRPFKGENRDSQPSSSTAEPRSFSQSQFSASPTNQFRIYPNQATSSQYQNDNSDDEPKHTRKRFRNERGNPMPVDDLIIDGPVAGVSMDRPQAIELDPSLTRELTNLCALAAPLSKQPRIRTSPARFAGKPFAQEALSQMFDGAGRLVVEPDLAAAQALCILQMHDIQTKEKNAVWSSRFHELALQIVEGLGVHSPEHPTLTPVPSQEFVQRSIEREAIRRIFWLIHLLDVIASIYFKKPVTFADHELRLRLPVDETSFELGVHSTLPEYLYLPAVRTQYASELGHLIRILSIYAKMEFALDEVNDTEIVSHSAAALKEAEQKMEEWDRTLPDHLRFSQQSLQVQQSMFETSSNTGAWCWCSIHVYHASCALVLNLVQQRMQRGPKTEPTWALQRIELILQMLGDRAKNSILMGAALWSLVKYCKRDDPQVRKWSSDYEEASGTKVIDLVQDWRPQPSPPQSHQHPVHSHPHAQQSQQQQQQSQQQAQNPPHGNSYHTQHQPQISNRRLSDVRNSVSQGVFSLNSSNTQRAASHQQHAAEGASYGNNNSNVPNSMKRSPSHSPTISYPLQGRPSNINSSGNSGSTSNRSLGMNQHLPSSLPDSSMNNNNGNGGSNSLRDPRGVQSSMNASAGSGGTGTSALGHDGKGCDPQSQTQMQSGTAKYGNREANHQANAHHSRWSVDSVGGNGSDGTQPGYSSSVTMSDGKLSRGSEGSTPGGAQRNFGALGEGIQSLPSLKASGLLDSWGSTSRNGGNADVQKQTSNGASQQQQQQQEALVSPRKTTPPPGSMNLTMLANPRHSGLHADTTELRPQASLAMPVGLQWLANESR